MKKLGLLLIFFSLNSFAIELDASRLNFKYQPNEDKSSQCTHEIENPNSGDWTVKCPYYNKIKEFSVHLLVRQYKRDIKPKTKYEILYWVTNRLHPRQVPEFTGTTIWFTLLERSWPESLFLSQHVDNGYASLDLELKLRKDK